jgi:2-phosphosulfolactate phosphatase
MELTKPIIPRAIRMRPLRVHLLPKLIQPDDLAATDLPVDGPGERSAGGTCVVIDVLRATTTIVHALDAGATAVIPCSSIEEARDCHCKFPAGTAVLGGERRGLPIEGFDLGNSPREYSASSVGGKRVILTTTNGTAALLQAREAREIVLGAFVNLSAVCARLTDRMQVDLLCAGTDGQITREDVLLAGAIVARLTESAYWTPNDEAVIARAAWTQVEGRLTGSDLKARLTEALRASHGGRNLLSIGMGPDIEQAAEIDRFPLVPRFNPISGEIKLGWGQGDLRGRAP